VDRLLAADSALASWDPPDLERPGAAFEAIRIHGDFHLGQTLKTREGYIVIDFEGEPAVPRAERRRKQPAMRDVAGMLRSFDYAVVASKAGGDREDVVGRMRSAYLDGYRRSVAARNPSIAPEAPAARDAWIEFFELSKALYEIDYELDNRPDWLGIPLGGIVRLLERPTTNGVRA
jgi:maltokinase